MKPTILQKPVPLSSVYCFVPPPSRPRPINGIVFHHTATSFPARISTSRQASWGYQLLKDGVFEQYFLDSVVTYHSGNTNRMALNWVQAPPKSYGFSAINWCSLGVEIVYDPVIGEVPTYEQMHAARDFVAYKQEEYRKIFPTVGHGEFDDTKWPTEPHGFDWSLAGFTHLQRNVGHFLVSVPTPPPTPPIPPEPPAPTPEEPNMEGIINELNDQIVKLRAEIDSVRSENGYLKEDVEKPLRIEVAALKQENAQLREQLENQPIPQPDTTPKVTAVEVIYDDGHRASWQL